MDTVLVLLYINDYSDFAIRDIAIDHRAYLVNLERSIN